MMLALFVDLLTCSRFRQLLFFFFFFFFFFFCLCVFPLTLLLRLLVVTELVVPLPDVIESTPV